MACPELCAMLFLAFGTVHAYSEDVENEGRTVMNRFFAIIISMFLLVGFVSYSQPVLAEENPDGEELSMSQTSYTGARLLKGTENVQVGAIGVGPYDDFDSRDRYSYWQGDTHFAGVEDPQTGNKVDIVTEWFWFESSIPRNSDFYVGVIKVKSSPNPVDDWYLKEENGWYGNIMWPDDVVQLLRVEMDSTGVAGGIRWDWSVPFDTYSWEPEKNIEVASGYSAGFDVNGGFSEGGVLKDLTDKSNIQAKGYIKGSHSVSTKYTITLYKWQVLVSSGADNMQWQMRILKGGNNDDSAYHEYFVVIQAEKGKPVHIPAIHIAANFKHSMWWWFDNYQALSATIHDVTFTPPPSCYIDDEVPEDACSNEGICANSAGFCDPFDGVWACNNPAEFEAEEVTCDGLDNDCDGLVDEAFVKLGLACDGNDDDKKKNGLYVCDETGTGLYCDEDPCAGKECGDGCGECGMDEDCVSNQCVGQDLPDDIDEPVFDCNGITEVGQCDGSWLFYCAGGNLVEQYCAGCCGLNQGKGYYECLPLDQCQQEECIPQCDDKWCGSDGCGGICGVCDDGETCSWDGECIDSGYEISMDDKDDQSVPASICGDCPAGTICGADGICVPLYAGKADGLSGDKSNGNAQGCTASFTGTGTSGAWLIMLLMALVLMATRRFGLKQQ
jgi:hypothetical protein